MAQRRLSLHLLAFSLPVCSSLPHPSAERLRLHDDFAFLISYNINGIIRIMHLQGGVDISFEHQSTREVGGLGGDDNDSRYIPQHTRFFLFSLLLALQARGTHSR